MTLLINAGNNIDNRRSMYLLEAEYTIAALNLTGVDFIALGAWDVAAGLDNVKKIARTSVADIVCANISGFLPYLRFNRGDRKILVTSVFDPELLKTYKIKGIKIGDPVQTIRRLQQKIKHDLFIVVIQARDDRLAAIAAEMTGIDLIINGDKMRRSSPNDNLSGTPLVYNNFRGMNVSYIDMVKGERGDIEIKGPKTIRVSVKTVAEDRNVATLMKKYYNERRMRLRMSVKGKEKEVKLQSEFNDFYLGSKWCAGCHQEIWKRWSKTSHSQAIRSLVDKRRDKDPDCVKCHVTGYKDKRAQGGYLVSDFQSSKKSLMEGVQCEACHGAGGKHAVSKGMIKMPQMKESKCINCHNLDSDPEFDFKTDFQLLNHGNQGER